MAAVEIKWKKEKKMFSENNISANREISEAVNKMFTYPRH